MNEKGGKGDREGSRFITDGLLMRYSCGQWGLSLAGDPLRGECVTVLRIAHQEAKKLGPVPLAPAPHWLRAAPCCLNSPACPAFSDYPRCWEACFPASVWPQVETQVLGAGALPVYGNCSAQLQDLWGCQGDVPQQPLHRHTKPNQRQVLRSCL